MRQLFTAVVLFIAVELTLQKNDHHDKKQHSISNQTPEHPKKLCCKVENSRLLSLNEKLQSFKQKCDEENKEILQKIQESQENGTMSGWAAAIPRSSHKEICQRTCTFREGNALGDKDYVDAEKARKLVEEAVSEGIPRDIALKNTDECVRLANLRAQFTAKSVERGQMCNMASTYYYLSLLDFVIMDCPEENRANHPECKKFIKYATIYYDRY